MSLPVCLDLVQSKNTARSWQNLPIVSLTARTCYNNKAQLLCFKNSFSSISKFPSRSFEPSSSSMLWQSQQLRKLALISNHTQFNSLTLLESNFTSLKDSYTFYAPQYDFFFLHAGCSSLVILYFLWTPLCSKLWLVCHVETDLNGVQRWNRLVYVWHTHSSKISWSLQDQVPFVYSEIPTDLRDRAKIELSSVFTRGDHIIQYGNVNVRGPLSPPPHLAGEWFLTLIQCQTDN